MPTSPLEVSHTTLFKSSIRSTPAHSSSKSIPADPNGQWPSSLLSADHLEPHEWTYLAEGGKSLLLRFDGSDLEAAKNGWLNHNATKALALRLAKKPRGENHTPTSTSDGSVQRHDFESKVAAPLLGSSSLVPISRQIPLSKHQKSFLRKVATRIEMQRPRERRNVDGIDIDADTVEILEDLSWPSSDQSSVVLGIEIKPKWLFASNDQEEKQGVSRYRKHQVLRNPNITKEDFDSLYEPLDLISTDPERNRKACEGLVNNWRTGGNNLRLFADGKIVQADAEATSSLKSQLEKINPTEKNDMSVEGHLTEILTLLSSTPSVRSVLQRLSLLQSTLLPMPLATLAEWYTMQSNASEQNLLSQPTLEETIEFSQDWQSIRLDDSSSQMSSSSSSSSSAHVSRPSSRLVGVSTKMYFDIPKTTSYLATTLSLLPEALKDLAHPTKVFFLPDFVTLQSSVSTAKGSSLIVGAQHTHHADTGAFTGEVSPKVLAQAGAQILEIGHAERRKLFGETDAGVVEKSVAAARNGLTPLICVGEVSKEGGVEKAVQECWQQVSNVFAQVPKGSPIILAYEPVWAIGASQPATPSHVVAVTQELRRKCAQDVGWTGDDLIILYGGSAGPGTFGKIQDGVDGLFLGRFAHDPEAFVRTIQEVGEGKRQESISQAMDNVDVTLQATNKMNVTMNLRQGLIGTLLSATFKDCSLFFRLSSSSSSTISPQSSNQLSSMTVTSTTEDNTQSNQGSYLSSSTGQNDTQTDNIPFGYAVKVIDVDLKPLSKFHNWVKLDQEIEDGYQQWKEGHN
ncbi:unnamed protein product [Sympodiomycopsis kandeliae]